MIGQLLRGRYEIIQKLGGGGFGETFLARDNDLPGKPFCVVKQLKLNHPPEILPTVRRLFDTEAKTLYQLGKSDQIPRLLAHFEENQQFYLVQEYIDGHVLKQEIQSGKQLSEQQTIAILYDVLSILEFVHQQGVIHRDIKPDNLIRRNSQRNWHGCGEFPSANHCYCCCWNSRLYAERTKCRKSQV
jgi:serine/threonine protein kinase